MRATSFLALGLFAGCSAADVDGADSNCVADTDVGAPAYPEDKGLLDAYAPVVVSTTPMAGDQEVDPGLNRITVVFSAAMQDQSWSWVQYDAATFPEIVGDPEYIDAHTNVVHVVLEPKHTYVVGINGGEFAGFQSKAGQAANPYLLTFYTRAE